MCSWLKELFCLSPKAYLLRGVRGFVVEPGEDVPSLQNRNHGQSTQVEKRCHFCLLTNILTGKEKMKERNWEGDV